MDFESLFAKRANHIKPGLERIRRSYEYLGRPAVSIPSVLIGGTNGKGSTSGFVWAMLALNGKKVGLSSSPHLVEFSERFQMSGESVSDADMSRAWQGLKADLSSELYEELSFFEISTLLAFRLFEEKKADFQVLEVGLGGRWDASNISDPCASVVVSVSRDHKEFLGEDLFGILREKFAIGRSGRPLFWGAQGEVMGEPGVDDFIATQVKESGAVLYVLGQDFLADDDSITILLPNLKSTRLPYTGITKGLPQYLRNNLALAAAFYHWYASQPQSTLSPLTEIWPEFCRGAQTAPVTLAGRAQRVVSRAGPHRKFLIDVCHNPDGARAFAKAIKDLYPEQSLAGYVSILRDKDYDTILDILRSVLHPVILFGIESERTWNVESLAARHQDLPFFTSLEQAWSDTESDSNAALEPWAICGSVAAVGHAMTRMKVLPKELTLASIISGDWSPHTDKS